MFNFGLRFTTHKSFTEALPNVIEKTFLSIPHSTSKLYIFSAKDAPLCGGGMNEKFNTLLDNTKLLSIKCAVRQIYPSVVKEVHKSDVKLILPGQTFNKDLTLCFSNIYILIKSALAVFVLINDTSLRKYLYISLTPSYSTYEKDKSCLKIVPANNSLYLLGQNFEALTDKVS
jgi:hypothetical protein